MSSQDGTHLKYSLQFPFCPDWLLKGGVYYTPVVQDELEIVAAPKESGEVQGLWVR